MATATAIKFRPPIWLHLCNQSPCPSAPSTPSVEDEDASLASTRRAATTAGLLQKVPESPVASGAGLGLIIDLAAVEAYAKAEAEASADEGTEKEPPLSPDSPDSFFSAPAPAPSPSSDCASDCALVACS